ncbi:MAG TPA: peptidase S41 [Holosporales bacterium]|nr:peptidase S41 [Holosporales bacterium]
MNAIRALFVIVLFAVSVSAVSAKSAEKTKSKELTTEQLNGFFNAIAGKIRGDYVEDVTNRELLEGALSGMISALDPHSTYLDEEKFNEIRNQAEGKFGGLGIEIIVEKDGIKVISPIEDTPAQKAGIKPGDVIVAIEGEPISSMSGFDALKKLRGDPGTFVNITVFRENQSPFDLKITREFIKVNPVKFRTEGNVGYIRITTFNDQTTTKVIHAIRSIKKEVGAKLLGYVLDLRNNPGGLLDQAVSVTSLFIGRDKPVVSIKGKGKKQFAEFKSNSSDMTGGLPVVVLVNSGSASASEIVAGALQDYKRAVVVGTKSFGKGSVQRISPLRNIGALKLTIALYYTPKGRSIQKEGIEPDIKVEQQLDLKTINSSKRLREAYLKDALKNGEKLENAKQNRGSARNDREDDDDDIKTIAKKKNFKDLPDYQLQQALNILRAIGLGFSNQ